MIDFGGDNVGGLCAAGVVVILRAGAAKMSGGRWDIF
jgi:hypothetical protein